MAVLKKHPKLFGLLVVIVIGLIAVFSYDYYQTKQKEYYAEFKFYNHMKIKDYEFIADGKGIAIEWEPANPEEYNKLKAENSNWRTNVSVGEKYLVRYHAKLRENSPVSTESIKEDEFITLGIYDLSSEPFAYKEVQLLDVLKDYNANIVFNDHMQIIKQNNQEYLGISVDIADERKLVWLNLATGKIEDLGLDDSAINYREFIPASSLYDYFADIGITYENYSFDKAPKFVKGNSFVLKEKNPKAFNLFTKKNGNIYVLTNFTDKPKQGFEESYQVSKELILTDVNLFELMTVPADESIDGQEHTINSYEELIKYYSSN